MWNSCVTELLSSVIECLNASEARSQPCTRSAFSADTIMSGSSIRLPLQQVPHIRTPTPALHHIFGQFVRIFVKKGSGLNTQNHQIRPDFGSGFPTNIQGSCSPALRFGFFLTSSKPYYFLATTLGFYHGHQIPEIEGPGERSLLVECSHQSRRRRKGSRERHTSLGCVQCRFCPSHHD